MSAVPTLFRSKHRDSLGKLLYDSGYRHNERENAGINQQSLQMGDTLGKTGTAMTSITATSASLTGLDNSGGATSTFAGKWLVTFGASGTLVATARIISSTVANPSVVIIDFWQDGTGTLVTTPVTGTWHILEGGTPCNWLALSSTAFVGDVTQTTLAGEFTSNGLTRAKGTYAHTANATSYTLTKTFTASGGGGTVNQEAVFGARDTTAGGPMAFRSAMPSPPVMLAGDTLAETVTVSF